MHILKRVLPLISFIALSSAIAAPAAVPETTPSRAPESGCHWKQLINLQAGLAVWVQQCDGQRQAPLFKVEENSLVAYYPETPSERLIEIFDLLRGESPSAGMQRIFRTRTQDSLQRLGCVIQPYQGHLQPPPGIHRFAFIPTFKYAQVLATEIHAAPPPPPCGPWGKQTTLIQYFEVQTTPNSRRFAFVKIGTPPALFDEQTFILFPPIPDS